MDPPFTPRRMPGPFILIWGRTEGLRPVTHTGSLALSARARAFGATSMQIWMQSQLHIHISIGAILAPLASELAWL